LIFLCLGAENAVLQVISRTTARSGAHFYATGAQRRAFLSRWRAATTSRRAFLSQKF